MVDADGALNGPSGRHRSALDRKRDRLAELRAVELATKALEADGWSMSADRQTDGVGYDLEFRRADRRLHVEVKGVQGADLTFNLTPKEWWRVKTDEEFVVVAVTSVLSPRSYTVNLLARDRLASATRRATGYRLDLG